MGMEKITIFNYWLSRSVEGGDGWLIVWRAQLHLQSQGIDSFVNLNGTNTATCILLEARIEIEHSWS